MTFSVSLVYLVFTFSCFLIFVKSQRLLILRQIPLTLPQYPAHATIPTTLHQWSEPDI